MTQRLQVILVAAAAGAVIGAAAAFPSLRSFIRIPAFALDRAVTTRWEFIATALGWVAFSLYWEAAARKASADQKVESDASRGVHVFLANASLLLVMIPIRGAGRWLPVSSAIMICGLAVEAAGLFLAIWARRHLGRNWSGRITIKVEHQLIRSGPYRRLRHPIYTGLLAMYAGSALVTGEWLGILGLAIAAFAYWRKIRLEEKNMDLLFGPEYAAYRRQTWALIPGLF